MPLPTLYTPSEVAGKLKVNRRSVYQWLTSGQLKGLRAGQGWRITEEDLIVFMRGRAPLANETETNETNSRAIESLHRGPLKV